MRGRTSFTAAISILLAAGCSSDGTSTKSQAGPLTGWQRGPDAPVRLSEVGGAAYQGRIWTAGGLTGDGRAARTVLVFDPASGRWRSGPSLPTAVHHPVLVGGDRLYLIGGYRGDSFSAASPDVWVLDSSGRTWTKGPALPEPRAAGAGAWDGSRIVYGGGVGPEGTSADVLALEAGVWRRIGALSRPRQHLGAAADRAGRTWFLAGRVSGLDSNLADVDLVSGDRVSRIGALPTARGGVAGFHVPGIGGCLAGGERNGGTHGEVECMDADGRITRLPELGQSRHGIGAATLGGIAYVILGGPAPGLHVSATLERLRLAASPS